MAQWQGVRTAYVPAPVTDVAASQSTAQRRAITNPIAVFLLLSGLFGTLTLVLTPPLHWRQPALVVGPAVVLALVWTVYCTLTIQRRFGSTIKDIADFYSARAKQ